MSSFFMRMLSSRTSFSVAIATNRPFFTFMASLNLSNSEAHGAPITDKVVAGGGAGGE
jgi:hypothetical protein